MLPVLILILGAFPKQNELADFTLPGIEVRRWFLPGFHSARTPELSIPAFAGALDTDIETRFKDRPVIVMGISTGALVALALRAKEVQHLILVEPFFRTAEIEPFINWLVRTLDQHPHNTLLHEWVFAIFGVGRDAILHRDYSRLLLDSGRSISAVVGDPTVATEGLPSLTSSNDRALLAKRGVQLRSYRGGHAPPYSALFAAVREALAIINCENDEHHGARSSGS